MSARRIATLVTLTVALVAIAELTGLRARLSLDGVRALTASAGLWGMLLFVALFSAAQLVYAPGAVFMAAAVVSWGQLLGGTLAWLGALTAASVTFAVARSVGGKAPEKLARPRVERLLALVDRRPIRAVFLLRLMLWSSPLVNYGLALSRVRFRDFAVGTAAGLLAPVLVVTLFVDRVLSWLAR